jgi:hypothetical protein
MLLIFIYHLDIFCCFHWIIYEFKIYSYEYKINIPKEKICVHYYRKKLYEITLLQIIWLKWNKKYFMIFKSYQKNFSWKMCNSWKQFWLQLTNFRLLCCHIWLVHNYLKIIYIFWISKLNRIHIFIIWFTCIIKFMENGTCIKNNV